MRMAISDMTSSLQISVDLKLQIEGLSHKFDKEFWNYAKLISGVLRYGMPIDQVIKLVSGLQLDSESINTWKVGVERALKKYIRMEHKYQNSHAQAVDRNRWFIRKVVLLVKIAVTHVVDDSFSTYN